MKQAVEQVSKLQKLIDSGIKKDDKSRKKGIIPRLRNFGRNELFLELWVMLYDVTYRPEKSTELFDSADVNGLMLMDEMAKVISEYSKVSQEVESVEQDIKIEIDQEPTETKVTTGILWTL